MSGCEDVFCLAATSVVPTRLPLCGHLALLRRGSVALYLASELLGCANMIGTPIEIVAPVDVRAMVV